MQFLHDLIEGHKAEADHESDHDAQHFSDLLTEGATVEGPQDVDAHARGRDQNHVNNKTQDHSVVTLYLEKVLNFIRVRPIFQPTELIYLDTWFKFVDKNYAQYGIESEEDYVARAVKAAAFLKRVHLIAFLKLVQFFPVNQYLDSDRDFTENSSLAYTYTQVTKGMHVSANNLEPFAVILDELCRRLPNSRQNIYHYNNIE